MITCLVLASLHVATVLLHRNMHCRDGPQCLKVDKLLLVCVCLFVCLFVCLLFVCLFACLSVCLSVCLFCMSYNGRVGWGARAHDNVVSTCSATCCYGAQISGCAVSLYTLSRWSAVFEGQHMGCQRVFVCVCSHVMKICLHSSGKGQLPFHKPKIFSRL